CAGCETVLLEQAVIEHVAQIFGGGRGIEEWYLRGEQELLPPGTRCRQCGGSVFRKGTDTLDVWFDSGCSHAAVLETRPELRWPAELYLEGSDQHRGWFHSSLLEAMATRGAPPYKCVLTCGFVIDTEARKMSKSVGNTVAPGSSCRSTGPRCCGSGWQRRTTPMTSGSRPRSSTGWPTPIAASGTRFDSCSAISATSSQRVIGSPTRGYTRSTAGSSTAWPASSAGSGGLTRSTSSTPSSTVCTTSALSISPRSTLTSSRTGSTPRR